MQRRYLWIVICGLALFGAYRLHMKLTATPPGPEVAGGEIVAPYEPTPDVIVQSMLRLGNVGPQDVVIDLGSGDGRIPVTAARDFGARGIGVELDPRLLQLSRDNAAAAGVADRVVFRAEDLFKADLSEGTVITLFLFRWMNLKLRSDLLDLKPGTRIVAHYHDVGDWHPDREVRVESDTRYRKSWVRLYVVPAKISGGWRWEEERGGTRHERRLAVTQNFQQIDGSLRTETGQTLTLHDPKLSGTELSFWLPQRDGAHMLRWHYRGRVEGDRIAGTAEAKDARGTHHLVWAATRD